MYQGGCVWAKMSLSVCLLASVLVPTQPLSAQSIGLVDRQGPSHRVVMHVNSGEDKVQRGALNNIRHLYQEVGREHLMLEVVVHGAGLALLSKKTSLLAGELAQLKTEFGVHYTACSNTMKAMQLTREDLLDVVGDTVPAMVRLMERQEQGWVYIKP